MSAMRSTRWCGTPQHWDPTERAQREHNIFMLRYIRKVSSRGQFSTKTPQNFNNLVFLCIQKLCEIWSHSVCCSFHSNNRVTWQQSEKKWRSVQWYMMWHSCCSEKRNNHYDSKLYTPLECMTKLSCWSFEVVWLTTDLGSWLYVYSVTWKCCVLVVRVP